ncbi:copper amine oxidase N-terminal domain-containing protein [Anaerosolibacter carboniphilus]|uniref:copper amine oxidase N-terminal domain-containing protein n=1 Tax=Anaerosolibacter carboniphilus TaxID=1417629 RepID=UPI0038CC0823
MNNRTLVPLRAIFEALGAEIKWDGATETVTGIKGETIVELKIGSNVAKLNGKDLNLDVPATIVNKRTLVPARFIAECLGAKVDWESSSRTVIIQHD